jgi:hypothetical protein
MNVGFIDGHVDTTRVPLNEPWDWSFEPVR